MPLMDSPYSLGLVDVPDGLVDRFRESGFRVVEEQAAESEKPAPKRRGRSRKSDS